MAEAVEEPNRSARESLSVHSEVIQVAQVSGFHLVEGPPQVHDRLLGPVQALFYGGQCVSIE